MKLKNLIHPALIAILAVSITRCNFSQTKTTSDSIDQLSIDSVKAISKEAYIYGFPLVDNYRVQYDYFVDKSSSEFKGSWNSITNIARVFTPKDVAVQTPNSDTPYSWLGIDLRAEPIILSVPAIESNRFYHVQFIDNYTFNFDYIGSRTTGNKAGNYMVVGPNWNGETIEGIDGVIKSETEFVTSIYRIQLFNPEDIGNVKKIQSQFKVQPLSTFINAVPSKAAKTIDFINPLSPMEQKTSLEFFNIMNFVMQFCPTNPAETKLMDRFAKIGIGAGKTIDIKSISPEIKAAMEAGIKEAWEVDFASIKKKFDEGLITSGDVFGTRSYLNNNYLLRMTGAVLGIYGNSKQEAIYPFYSVDSESNKLDATTNKYTLYFDSDGLPPVNSFWSLTVYKLPESLLAENSINRYLINSPMLPNFKKDKDGGITLYIQNESPGEDKESNWLPAPKGPFVAIMRLYWPKEEALDGTWKRPMLNLVK